jgi:hypothetical protein
MRLGCPDWVRDACVLREPVEAVDKIVAKAVFLQEHNVTTEWDEQLRHDT